MSCTSSTVEIVVPVYNEENVLETSIRTLRSYLDHRFPFGALVTSVAVAALLRSARCACLGVLASVGS